MILKFELPLFVQLSKNKRFILNLNKYRNAHFRELAKAKLCFKKQFNARYGLSRLKTIELCGLEYVVFFRDKRKVDLSNVASVVDKFASDCLVENGYIRDDNRKVVKSVKYIDGGIDKENPRVELTVMEVKK